jgi:hypothetical protein
MPRPAGYQLCRRWSHSQAAIGNNKQYGVFYTMWCELYVVFEGSVATVRLQCGDYYTTWCAQVAIFESAVATARLQ